MDNLLTRFGKGCEVPRPREARSQKVFEVCLTLNLWHRDEAQHIQSVLPWAAPVKFLQTPQEFAATAYA
eukprot:8304087-Lingulodinium_polyedra.AAC.1